MNFHGVVVLVLFFQFYSDCLWPCCGKYSVLHTCSFSSWLLSAVSFKSLFSIRRLSICFSITAYLSSFPFIILCWILSSSTNFKSLCRFLISCFALLNSPLSFSNSSFCWESSLGSCVTIERRSSSSEFRDSYSWSDFRYSVSLCSKSARTSYISSLSWVASSDSLSTSSWRSVVSSWPCIIEYLLFV
jgi:hypothetical protein